MNALGLTYSEASGPPNFWTELCGTPSTTCVPTVARSPWGHHIAACLLQWQGQATIPASGHISGSNLNPNAWGLLEPSPGGRVTAGDTTILMVRGRGVTTSHHCTQDPHECRKSTVTNPITMKKKFVSWDKSVSTFHQNNTASIGFASVRPTPGLKPTRSSTLFPNTRGIPVQDPSDGGIGGNVITPRNGGPGIHTSHQYNWDPPGQYTMGECREPLWEVPPVTRS